MHQYLNKRGTTYDYIAVSNVRIQMNIRKN